LFTKTSKFIATLLLLLLAHLAIAQDVQLNDKICRLKYEKTRYPISVVNIRYGTNGKYVIVGRSMQAIKVATKRLSRTLGKENILAFDDAYIRGQKFHLDGYEYTLSDGTKVVQPAREWSISEAFDDMKNNPLYDNIKTDGYIAKIEDLQNIPMYRINGLWIKQIVEEGYTIINIGNPMNLPESFFYNQEKQMLGW